MKPDQKAIYYILGDDPTSVGRSPHLDYFRAHDIEVLYLTETVDSFMVLGLREFEGKPVQNVDDAGLELATEAPATDQLPVDQFNALVERFRRVLGERITGVRESKLLTDSPCRLVSPRARWSVTWRACGACSTRISRCPKSCSRSIATWARPGVGAAGDRPA